MVVFRRTVNDEAAAIQPPSRFCPEFYGGASAKRTLLRLIEGGVIVAVVGDYLQRTKTGHGKRTRMPNYLSLYPFLVRSTNRGIVGLALALALAAAAGNLLHGYARSLLRLRGIRN